MVKLSVAFYSLPLSSNGTFSTILTILTLQELGERDEHIVGRVLGIPGYICGP
jgi:hypothetical protein